MNFRTISRLLVVAVLVLQLPVPVAASTTADIGLSPDVIKAAPSKACHPKKPITCRAAELSIALAAEPASADAVASSEVAGVSAIAIPGAAANSLSPKVESKQAAACYGPLLHLCRTDMAL